MIQKRVEKEMMKNSGRYKTIINKQRKIGEEMYNAESRWTNVRWDMIQ